mmetsp:Transcript_26135/g.83893  ORF Transcript_26135/g.83893 Transcript_26135/m.83893 type:complete len:353 (+) Transcript_26135:1275-2333(+)
MVQVNRRLASLSYKRKEEALKLADEVRESVMSLLIAPAPLPTPGGRPPPAAEDTPLYKLMMLEQDLATGRDGATGGAIKQAETLSRIVGMLVDPLSAPPPSARSTTRVSTDSAHAASFSASAPAAESTGGAAGAGAEAEAPRAAEAEEVLERQRLLLLASLALPLSDSARRPITRASALDSEQLEAVSRGLFCLGARPGRRGTGGAPKPPPPPGTALLCRHTPALAPLLRSALGGGSGFTWLRRRVREPGDRGAAGGVARPDLAAGRVGSWALRGKAGSDRPGKPLVLVFMVGGASHAEVRCVHEVAAATHHCDLLFGATALLTPTQFARELVSMERMPPLSAAPVSDDEAE